MSEEDVEIVRRGLEAFRDRDVEGALALAHPRSASGSIPTATPTAPRPNAAAPL
jgi:hypothetical protein